VDGIEDIMALARTECPLEKVGQERSLFRGNVDSRRTKQDLFKIEREVEIYDIFRYVEEWIRKDI
jgi:hypothetical protein